MAETIAVVAVAVTPVAAAVFVAVALSGSNKVGSRDATWDQEFCPEEEVQVFGRFRSFCAVVCCVRKFQTNSHSACENLYFLLRSSLLLLLLSLLLLLLLLRLRVLLVSHSLRLVGVAFAFVGDTLK